MSVQINQYLMWGVVLPWSFVGEWEKDHPELGDFSEHFDKFMDDSAFKSEVNHHDGIFCLFDGMNGNYIVIGRVLEKSADGDWIASEGPMVLNSPTDLEKELIHCAVERNFGVFQGFGLHLITHYR